MANSCWLYPESPGYAFTLTRPTPKPGSLTYRSQARSICKAGTWPGLMLAHRDRDFQEHRPPLAADLLAVAGPPEESPLRR